MIDSEDMKVNIFFRMLGSAVRACLVGLAILAILSIATLSEAQTVSQVPDSSYVRYATGMNIYGSPKEWYTLATRYGYYVADKPVTGGVVSFDSGAYGTTSPYGFVGVVVYYQEDGGYWNIGTRYAYAATASGNYYSHSYVKEQSFRVLKKYPQVHFIYRSGMNARHDTYYYQPEYAGYEVVGKQYTLSDETKEVTVYPENSYVKEYVRPGQVVRVLARAEVGETLWVFVKTPYRTGKVYVKTYYQGKEQLKAFDASAADAYQMYYVKNYGDTVLDLGYADYSKIAGDSGEVTITIKKGRDPMRLQPLQSISLQLAQK
jgi:hypothetical protein